MELDSKFEVEPGNGQERDEVLAKQNVETFLIVPPKKDGRNGQVRMRSQGSRRFFLLVISVIDGGAPGVKSSR